MNLQSALQQKCKSSSSWLNYALKSILISPLFAHCEQLVVIFSWSSVWDVWCECDRMCSSSNYSLSVGLVNYIFFSSCIQLPLSKYVCLLERCNSGSQKWWFKTDAAYYLFSSVSQKNIVQHFKKYTLLAFLLGVRFKDQYHCHVCPKTWCCTQQTRQITETNSCFLAQHTLKWL